MFNPAIGYSQGMSDLVAPILAEVLDESDTFWCFVGLMQNTIFISSPRDEDMEKQLVRWRAEQLVQSIQFGPVCNFSLPHSNWRNDLKLLSGLCEIMHQSHKVPDG